MGSDSRDDLSCFAPEVYVVRCSGVFRFGHGECCCFRNGKRKKAGPLIVAFSGLPSVWVIGLVVPPPTVQDLEMTIKALTGAIDTLKSEIAEMQVQLKRAGEDREKENKEFQMTVADQRQYNRQF